MVHGGGEGWLALSHLKWKLSPLPPITCRWEELTGAGPNNQGTFGSVHLGRLETAVLSCDYRILISTRPTAPEPLSDIASILGTPGAAVAAGFFC